MLAQSKHEAAAAVAVAAAAAAVVTDFSIRHCTW
jgi:hypothetical protein